VVEERQETAHRRVEPEASPGWFRQIEKFACRFAQTCDKAHIDDWNLVEVELS